MGSDYLEEVGDVAGVLAKNQHGKSYKLHILIQALTLGLIIFSPSIFL